MDYGEQRAIAAIRKLPAGTYTYEVRHDPVAGVADEGIPIKAKVTVDPKKGLITVDVRDNPDCVPGGLEPDGGLRCRVLPDRRLLQSRLPACPITKAVPAASCRCCAMAAWWGGRAIRSAPPAPPAMSMNDWPMPCNAPSPDG